jgi:PhnB protein
MTGRDGNYPAIIPYLLVPDAPALIAFFASAFGAVQRFAVPTEAGGIMHGEIELGDSVLMISDAGPPRPPVSLCHYVPDVDAIYARALAAGAASLSPPETKDYGDRVAGVTDPAGNTWWLCARLA